MHKLPTLALLILAYAAATWFPQPGLWARELRLPVNAAMGEWGVIGTWLSQVRAANVLLAILLFSSGLSASWNAMREALRSESRLLSLAAITWALPLLAAVIAILFLKGCGAPDTIAFALWIVAVMPVANSSVGWANVMRANVPLSLTLLILSTSFSPLSSPPLIAAGSQAFGVELKSASHLAASGLGLAMFFAVWVLFPVALGAWQAGRMTPETAERSVPWARRGSMVMLLLLNDRTGAACLPSLIDEPRTFWWPVAAALGLVACVTGLCRSLPDAWTPIANGRRKALFLSVMMRNTGVALVFTTTSLPEYEAISLTIIAYTLVQHLVVSLLVGWREPLSADDHQRLAQSP